MILSEEPRKGVGSGDKTESGGMRGGKGRKSPAKKDPEEDEELDAEMDSFGDDDIDEEEDMEEENVEDDDTIDDDIDPFPPKGRSKNGKKSVMEDFDAGDTDIFERDFYDDDDDDDPGFDHMSKGSSSKESSEGEKRNLRPLGRRFPDEPKKNDPASDDPNERRKIK